MIKALPLFAAVPPRRRIAQAAVLATAAGLIGCAQPPQARHSNGKEYFSEAKYGHASPRLVAEGQPIPHGGGQYLVGRKLTYIDLSIFQIIAGLRYAFPKRMKRYEKKVPKLLALHDRVAQRPRIKAYLASERRIAFNEWGICRHYKELDA